MFVAPPGQLKSTIIKTCFEPYPDTMVLSDINVQTMNPLRDELASGRYKTMAFTAYEKIYERDPRTASNVEGQLKAMACEGFSEASFEDHRMQGVFEARAFILAAMIPALYRRKFPEWVESGFARRFLWSFYKFDDPDILVKAIHDWRRIELDHNIPVLPMRRIRFDVTVDESRILLGMCRYQPSRESPFVLLKKMLSVLKWRYPDDPDRPMEILHDFATSMEKRPTNLIIDIERPPERRKDVDRDSPRGRGRNNAGPASKKGLKRAKGASN